MMWFGRNFVELKPIPETRYDKELIALLTRDKEPYRVLQNFGVWVSARDAMDFDSVMSYGIYSATGYDTSMLRSYYEYIAQATGRKGSDMVLLHDVQVPYLSPAQAQTIDALNIKYIMVPLEYDPFRGNSRYRLIRDDGALYRLYEIPRCYPGSICRTARAELRMLFPMLQTALNLPPMRPATPRWKVLRYGTPVGKRMSMAKRQVSINK